MAGRHRANRREVHVFATFRIRVARQALLTVRIAGRQPHSGRCNRALRDRQRARNRHSHRAFNDHRGLRRGFLPRGLSDTCPQTGAVRLLPAHAGRCPTTLNNHLERRRQTVIKLADAPRRTCAAYAHGLEPSEATNRSSRPCTPRRQPARALTGSSRKLGTAQPSHAASLDVNTPTPYQSLGIHVCPVLARACVVLLVRFESRKSTDD